MKKYTITQIIIAVLLSPFWIPLGFATAIVKFNWEVIKNVWGKV